MFLPPSSSLCAPYPPSFSFPDCQQNQGSGAEGGEQGNHQAEKTQAITDDAQRDLDEALPMLDAALASLKSLNKNDVVEVSWCHTTVHAHSLRFVGSSLGMCLGIDVVD